MMKGIANKDEYAILFESPIFYVIYTQKILPVPYPRYTTAFE